MGALPAGACSARIVFAEIGAASRLATRTIISRGTPVTVPSAERKVTMDPCTTGASRAETRVPSDSSIE